MAMKLKSLAQIPWNKAQWNHWDNLSTEEREDQELRYEAKRDRESDYARYIRRSS